MEIPCLYRPYARSRSDSVLYLFKSSLTNSCGPLGRSPCPMVNTLANHGYLPRNGLNVSLDDLVTAFNASVNLAPAATRLVGAKALIASTTGNSVTFNLDDLNTHGGMLFFAENLYMHVLIQWLSILLTNQNETVIEHDGSLSRNDIFFGDNHSFNKTIWDSVAVHFTSPTISIANAAAARAARLSAAQDANPEFNMTATDVQFSLIESSLYLAIFGNVADGNAVTKWVDIMFSKSFLRKIQCGVELLTKRYRKRASSM